ncbi:MAG: twin-arginine translocase TatA/TatE family subunit [Pseudomonadota bacterium]
MPSPWQLALVVVLAVVLFGGRGRISSIMGDLANGLTAFRKGLKDEDEEKPSETPGLTASAEPEESPQETRAKTEA